MSETEIGNFLKNHRPDLNHQNDTFKKLSERYGTYQSLAKDMEILYYFLSNRNKEPISQKLVIEHFKDMHPSTTKKHIYHLKSIGVIKEHASYRSCYCLNYTDALSMMSNFDTLIRRLLGSTVHDMYSDYLRGRSP